jgi:hypothetical protein
VALSFIGYHGTASAATVATTNAVGDLLLVRAYRTGNGTPPSLPSSGWNNLGTAAATGGAGSTQTASRTGWRIATATNEGSGTWTNANGVEVLVFRGVDATTPIGNVNSAAENATRTYIRYPAINRTKAGNWFAAFGSRLSSGGNAGVATSPNDGTTTITNRGSVPATPYLSAHAAEAQGNWSSTDVSIASGNVKYNGWVIEVQSDDPPPAADLTSAGAALATGLAVLSLILPAPLQSQGHALANGDATPTTLAYTQAPSSTIASGSAALTQRLALVSTGDALASGSAVLTFAVSTVNLESTGDALATGSATLTQSVALASAGAGIADGTATLSVLTPDVEALTSTGDALGDGGATPTTLVYTQAPGSSLADGSALLTQSLPLASTGDALASGSAVLSVATPDVEPLASTGDALGDGVATPTTLAYTQGPSSTIAHGQVTGIVLSFAAAPTTDALANGSAVLTFAASTASLQSAGAGLADGRATLTQSRPLVSAGAALADGSALLTFVDPGVASLDSTGDTLANGSASLTQRVALVSAGQTLASGSALLTTRQPLQSAGAALATGSATLTQRTALSSATAAVGTGAASLTQSRPLASAGAVLASGSATLTVRVPLGTAATAALASGSAVLTIFDAPLSRGGPRNTLTLAVPVHTVTLSTAAHTVSLYIPTHTVEVTDG